jgi:hypothetical protein
MKGFDNIYANDLLFYTERMSKPEAINRKKKLFQKFPDFRQRIVSDVKYTFYENGTIKCDFTKEVRQKSDWKPYPSYLLLKINERNRPVIIGESDYHTDKILKYKLQLGEVTTREILTQTGSNEVNNGDVDNPDKDSIAPTASDTVLHSARNTIPFFENISIPKGYIFILIALLLIGAVAIFFAEPSRKKVTITQPNRVPKQLNNGPARNTVMVEEPVRRPERQERQSATPEPSSRMKERKSNNESEKQLVFEEFVVTLFDPLYFKFKKRKARLVYAGAAGEESSHPYLEFQFSNKTGDNSTFAVKTIFKNVSYAERTVKLFNHEQQRFHNQFLAESDVNLYYIVGIGGGPDSPQEIYLIPGSHLRSGVVALEALQPFRKLGMFFYNVSSGRLT